MIWSVNEVIAALSSDITDFNSASSGNVQMKLFDSARRIGVGVDVSGQRVLVLPAQDDVNGFSANNADFDPFCDISWIEKDLQLPSASTLTCRADFTSNAVVEAIAVVFVGLIELQVRFGSTGRAIWEMKELFENGFQARFSEETLVGLIGELLLISSSTNVSEFVKFWHTDIQDKFDFSSSNLRLEVKTSRNHARNHRFSSGQIGTSLDSKTVVASVILDKVEVGNTLSELVEEICLELEPKLCQRIIEVVIGTLGCDVAFTNHFKFDLVSSRDSIIFIEGKEIPRPIQTPGVVSMSWIASLTDLPSLDADLESVTSRF